MTNGSISKLRRTAIKLLGSLAEGSRREETSTLFEVREEFLASHWQAAYHALVAAGDGMILVFPKVHIVDFLFVRDGVAQINDAIRMDRKSVDFLLCDAKTMEPKAVVELFSNDKKHTYKPYQDPFVARVLSSSGLANFRIEARESYPIDELRERLIRRLMEASQEVVDDARSKTDATTEANSPR